MGLPPLLRGSGGSAVAGGDLLNSAIVETPEAAPGSVYSVTTANCDREPIHIPGSIQPHGALVAFDPSSGTVLHASTNLDRWLPVGPLPARGRSLAALFGEGAEQALLQALAGSVGSAVGHQVVDLPAREGQPLALEALVHSYRGVGFAEFEPVAIDLAPAHQRDWMQLFVDAIDALRSADDLDALVERMAQRVKHLTLFDRVMVYRFDAEWNGHVIADVHEDGMESFFDLHYPASDIPAQARELFRSNLVRYIADVGCTPVPVLPWLDNLRQQPLDMSLAALRSASPIHMQYLRNMGVAATLTISLLVEGRLWGLIACHHRTPRTGLGRVPIRLRRACHALSVTAGYMVAWHQQGQQAAALAALARSRLRVMDAFNHVRAPLAQVVEECGTALLQTVRARGGAFWRDGEVFPFGQWPNREPGAALLRQVRQALETSTTDLAHDDSLPVGRKASEDEPDDPARICGYLAVRLEAFAAAGIVWVRSAMRREVSWGGNPDKPVQVTLDASGQPLMSPRTSFARWVTVVKGRCMPWTGLDLGAARELRELVPVLAVRDSLAQVSLSDHRFRSLVAHQSDAYCQLDLEDRIVTLSKPLPTAHLSAEGRVLSQLFEEACAPLEIDELTRAIASRQPFRSLRLHGKATDQHGEFIVAVGGEPLRDAQDQIVGWHGTISDLTQEVAVQTALRLKEAAELSNLAKSNFLSQMSHELRTPLNAVLGFAQLLLLDAALDPAQREKVAHIKTAGTWLLEMISDLMDLSRIETGNLALRLEAVELRAMLGETLALVQAQAAALAIHIVNEDPGHVAWVRGDRLRLKQVFVNLASNALKYNRTHGQVRFSMLVDAASGTTRVEIHDSGIGMSAEQVGLLFQPFNRLGRERLGIQGTGIGLVIAKQLVEAMGGHIKVDSVAGQGSTFTVTLLTAEATALIQAPQPAGSAAAQPERVVLYVGDDTGNVVLMQSIVDSLPNVRLVHAETAERALDMSHEFDPAVVLIDIKLSGLPGMHLLKSIKTDPELQHLRCIAVDASTGEDLLELQFAGFEDRWMRPVNLKGIWSGLNAVLAP
jgi:light-regulated signal transduction histidine kinase (bacteriophytochrome)